MAEEMRNTPPGRLPEDDDRRDLFPPDEPAEETPQPPAEAVSGAPAAPAASSSAEGGAASAGAGSESNSGGDDSRDRMAERLERLGGEPAPAITPEEFARLQQAGQIHIDSRGRIRTTRREETEAGMSLRKRRAWYAA